jgi:muramoyltetrapeptide carboxypeptidase
MRQVTTSWQALQEGDSVEIIAPASRCSESELKSAIQSVRDMGLVPIMPDDIFEERHPLFSTGDQKRFEFLKAAFNRKESKALWCLRGGYGSIRLLPLLAKLKRPKKVKIVIGLSDISTLHNFLNQKWKWPTLHGPMLGTFAERGDEEKEEILDVLFGRVDEVRFPGLIPMNVAAKKNKKITGPITGGNLMTVQSSQGTKSEFHAKNAIVFLEEVSERGYRVDRLLVSLQQSGYFSKAKAVVLGDFLGGNEPDGQNFVNDVLNQFAYETKIPVLKGLQSGHGPLRRTVPFATKAVLDLGQGSLTAETNGYFWKP